MTKTIAFVHGISPIGGAERELLRYLDQLPQLGYQSIVICPPAGALADAVRGRGAGLYHCEFPPWRKLASLLRRKSSVDRLRRVFDECVPDLIHVNDIWWVPQTLRGVERGKYPVVAHVRQEIEPSKVLQYELQRVDLLFTVSHHIEAAVLSAGVKGDNVRTLYSGFDLTRTSSDSNRDEVRQLYSIPPDAFLLGTVANLFPRKGYEVMLDALPQVMRTQPSVHYLIVGTGDESYERMLRSRVQGLGLTGRVHFAGFQKEVYPILDAMDLYVQPSLMEGFGIAVIEAMAMGKAVVGTATGGLPEVIVNGETGLLVPPNDPVALAEAIQALLLDPGKRERFGQAGEGRARTHFTIEGMMRGLTSAYEMVMARRPCPGMGAVS